MHSQQLFYTEIDKSKYNTNREREIRTVTKAKNSAVAGTRTQPSQVSAPMNVLEPEDQQEIAILAYKFWQERGCPIGTPGRGLVPSRTITEGDTKPLRASTRTGRSTILECS